MARIPSLYLQRSRAFYYLHAPRQTWLRILVGQLTERVPYQAQSPNHSIGFSASIA
jgi:hypothetical protein